MRASPCLALASQRILSSSGFRSTSKVVRNISSSSFSLSPTSESLLTKKYTLPEAMEVISLLRQTSRFLSSDPIPPNTLQRILKLTSTTPTSFNLQPYCLLVVDSPEGRDALASCMLGANAYTVKQAPVSVVVLHFKNPYRLVDRLVALESKTMNPNSIYIKTLPMKLNFLLAPSILTHKLKRLGTHLASPFRPTPVLDSHPSVWAKKNSFLAVQQLLLSAASYGVSSCPMEGYDDQRVCSAFDLNMDEFSASLVVSLGYIPPVKGQEETHAASAAAERKEVEQIAQELNMREEKVYSSWGLQSKSRYDLGQLIFHNDLRTAFPF